MNVYTVQYTTDPEWDMCGCCSYWDAVLYILNSEGKIVHADHAFNSQCEDFNQVVERMRACGVTKLFPGSYIEEKDNTYYSDERDTTFHYGG